MPILQTKKGEKGEILKEKKLWLNYNITDHIT